MNDRKGYFDNISNVVGDRSYLLLEIVEDLLTMFSKRNIDKLVKEIKENNIRGATIIIKRLKSAALNFNMEETKQALNSIEKSINNKEKINIEDKLKIINKEVNKVREKLETYYNN